MPVVILERIPLPSLQTYTTISVLLFACAAFYAHQLASSPHDFVDNISNGTVKPESQEDLSNNRLQKDDKNSVDAPEVLAKNSVSNANDIQEDYAAINRSLPYDTYGWNFVFILSTETGCVLVMVNSAYCCLILLGKLIQFMVFGELRVSEQQHLKDRFWNFVFYKFIFIFGVMNVQTMDEVVLWVAWFTMLGFFHLLTQLSKARFEFLSSSPTTPQHIHAKLLSLLFAILAACSGLVAVAALTGLQVGITIFAFMVAEVILLAMRALYVVMRYIINLWDMNLEGLWENRSVYVYYTDLIFDIGALSIDFAHHLHMLLWGNIFLSMASLVIFMQLRYLFYEFQRRIKKHKNYLKVIHNVEARFPMATKEDLESNSDNCAICWERMESARKLPCGHLFHNFCLRPWLEQDTSCPTCRMPLNESQSTEDPNGNIIDRNIGQNNNIPIVPQVTPPMTNHFFHFDGSRYVSWLPSFSVEVTHTQLLANQRAHATVQNSQLDRMAREVQSVFTHMPLSVIIDDLRITHSVEFTIDNILEGRVAAPPITITDDQDASGDEDSPVLPNDVLSVDEELAAFTSSESILMDDNLPDLTENYTSLESDYQTTSGGRFSKSSSEREVMLEERKKAMVEQARRKYLAKSKDGTSTEQNENKVHEEIDFQDRTQGTYYAPQDENFSL